MTWNTLFVSKVVSRISLIQYFKEKSGDLSSMYLKFKRNRSSVYSCMYTLVLKASLIVSDSFKSYKVTNSVEMYGLSVIIIFLVVMRMHCGLIFFLGTLFSRGYCFFYIIYYKKLQINNASSTVSASFSNVQMHRRICYANYKTHYANDFVWTLGGTGTTLINNIFTVPGLWNYCYCNIGAPLYNRRISFDANTRQLFDFTFFANSAGQGQAVHVKCRALYAPAAIVSTSTWSSALGPFISDTYTYISPNTWHHISISINYTGLVTVSMDASVMLNNFVATNYGTYIGFLGDGANDNRTIKKLMIEDLK